MRRTGTDDSGVLGHGGDVSPWDIRYDPGDVRHLMRLDDGGARFTVWAEPDLVEAWLVLRHPDATVTAIPMDAIGRSDRFVYWGADLNRSVGRNRPETGRFRPTERIADGIEYSFAFRATGGSPVYRVPTGVSNAVERLDRWLLDPGDVPGIEVPAWTQGAVIYQIFPDRFAPGAAGEPTEEWDAPPTVGGHKGGGLDGVARNLGYLTALGVDVIYLNPIFVSPSNHRYDTIDYLSVDPQLGGDEALRLLVEGAHERQIRIILDASFNHVHPRFFAFQDLVEKGERSPYRDWFVVHDWPVRAPVATAGGKDPAPEPDYEAWYGVPTMPRVNLAHPPAREYMLDVARHWMDEFGIDGWRMDVVRYVDPDFWNDLRAVVRKAHPDAYLVCEVMGDAGPWLQGDRFDATMNYTFRSIVRRFLATDELDGPGFLDMAGRLLAQYAWPVTLANHNLIGSHDTPRFRSEASGDLWRLRLATVLQLTFPGAPGIYYGDEIGLTGGDDPGSRAGFPWTPDPRAHPLHQDVAALTALRRRRRSLRTGRFRVAAARGGLVVFDRVDGRQRTTVAINRGRRPATFETDRTVGVRWGAATVSGSTVTVPAREAALLW